MKKKIDRFVLQQILSETGGGTVYHALEELPGDVTRPVALKVLPVLRDDDPKSLGRFANEIRTLVALAGHPNVVNVYAMGLTDGLPWIAMEYVPTTLASVIGDQPAQAGQIIDIMKQVSAALLALHSLNPPLLHADLTPSNILIDRLNICKITDFGMAGPAAVDRTRVMATVRYAAPELLSRELGQLSPSTDLYALGHIAYEMALAGRLYRQQFPAIYEGRGSGREGTAASWMAWHCSMETRAASIAEVRADFPKDLAAIIARMMIKRQNERYPTVEAMLVELRRLSAGGPAAVAPAVIPPPVETAAAPAGAKRPAPAPTGERFYVRLGAQMSGPYDLTTLQRMVRHGQVTRLHKASSDRVSWQPLNTIEGLF